MTPERLAELKEAWPGDWHPTRYASDGYELDTGGATITASPATRDRVMLSVSHPITSSASGSTFKEARERLRAFLEERINPVGAFLKVMPPPAKESHE